MTKPPITLTEDEAREFCENPPPLEGIHSFAYTWNEGLGLYVLEDWRSHYGLEEE